MITHLTNKSIRSALLCGVLATTAVPVSAEVEIDFSGFATLGTSWVNGNNAEYRSNLAQDGADKSGTLVLDTRIGLQSDLQITPRLGGTVQLLAQEGYDGDPLLDVEWAFGRIEVNDSWIVRFGRLALPVFNLSDFRYVGLSMTPIRPPEDVYAQLPIGSFDGVDFIGNYELGNTSANVQLYYGGVDENGYDGLSAEAADAHGINIVLERGIARLRLGYLNTRILIESAQTITLAQGLAQVLPLIPTLEPLADSLGQTKSDMTMTAIGLNLDFDRVFINTEFARRNMNNWVPDVDSWSILVGLRQGRLTPYVFASAFRETEGDRLISLPEIPLLQELQTGLDLLLEKRNQNSFGMGARWVLAPSMSLKVQIENVSRDQTGVSLLRTTEVNSLDTGDDVVLFGITLDVVF